MAAAVRVEARRLSAFDHLKTSTGPQQLMDGLCNIILQNISCDDNISCNS
jgi:hypothetical protein